jgi:hypothetical protein
MAVVGWDWQAGIALVSAAKQAMSLYIFIFCFDLLTPMQAAVD